MKGMYASVLAHIQFFTADLGRAYESKLWIAFGMCRARALPLFSTDWL